MWVVVVADVSADCIDLGVAQACRKAHANLCKGSTGFGWLAVVRNLEDCGRRCFPLFR